MASQIPHGIRYTYYFDGHLGDCIFRGPLVLATFITNIHLAIYKTWCQVTCNDNGDTISRPLKITHYANSR